MTKRMKVCVREYPAFAATALENVQVLKLWTRKRKRCDELCSDVGIQTKHLT